MSAVVLFLNESVVDSLKGAYRLRKAYQLLRGLFDMIVNVDGVPTPCSTHIEEGTSKVAYPEDLSEADSDIFPDVCDDVANVADPVAQHSPPEKLEISTAAGRSEPLREEMISVRPKASGTTEPLTVSSSPAPQEIARHPSIATVASLHIPTPAQSDMTIVDDTVYAGTLMALGAIMLLISLLPPSLSRILSIIGFCGSRTQALAMLWKAAGQEGPFGGFSTFFLGTYYGNFIHNSDIIPDAFSTKKRTTGPTIDKLCIAIAKARQRYPNSALWAVQEARTESIRGHLEEAAGRLESIRLDSQMPHIQSYVVFEGALYTTLLSRVANWRYHLLMHQYEDAATWFTRMCEQNSWSPALYTYIAGICYTELSHQDHPDRATYAQKANDLLEKVPKLLERRRGIGGRRIPFESFVERKISRFRQIAGAQGRLVDGVRGPVTEEMAYLLCNGQKRMGKGDLEKSLASIEMWSGQECEAVETVALEFMKSVVDRNAGRLEAAKERIERKVIRETLGKRVPLGCNDWIPGFAYYEV